MGMARVFAVTLAFSAAPAAASATQQSHGTCQGRDHVLLHIGPARLMQAVAHQGLVGARPCMESCECWHTDAGGHSCGERVTWVAGPHGPHTGDRAAAAALVLKEFPEICKCGAEENIYDQVAGVGAWGGWCTCPDGHRYQVGDHNDACGSLACEGGVAGQCERAVVESRSGRRVRCAATTGEETTTATSTTSMSTPLPSPLYLPAAVTCKDGGSDWIPYTDCVETCPSDEYVLNCTGTHYFVPALDESGMRNTSSEYCPDGWTYRREHGYMLDDRDCCRCGHESVEPRVCREDCPCWNRTTATTAAAPGGSAGRQTCKDEFFSTSMWINDHTLDREDVGASVLRRFPQCTCSN